MPPKLRGEAAARAIEEKEERFRENNKIGSPDKEARAARRAARAAEAAAAAELARPPPPQIFLGIRASTEGADALSRSDDFDLTAYYVPRDPPPPPLETAIAPAVPPPPPPARTAAAAAAAAGAAAEQREAFEFAIGAMLQDVLSHADVHRALSAPPEAPIPWFVQMRDAKRADDGGAAAAAQLIGSGEVFAVEAEAAAYSAAVEAEMAPATAASAAAAEADEEGAPDAATGLIPDAAGGGAPTAADAEAEAARARAAREARAAEAARRSAIVGSSEFQEVVAYALEGTLFNLVNEVTHGEFSLDVMPRQVVRALDIQ